MANEPENGGAIGTARNNLGEGRLPHVVVGSDFLFYAEALVVVGFYFLLQVQAQMVAGFSSQ